jgi:hypothetical protein
MTRARLSLLLPLLALAGCATERKPLTGYDKQPPGILLDGTSRVMIWPIFDLPPAPTQIFRFRLNGQDGVIRTSDEGFYDYDEVPLQNWTGGHDFWFTGAPPGTYILELVDSAGQSWGQSPPLTIPPGADFSNFLVQLPAVIFAHYEGQTGSWTVDPTLQDADAATDEITVTNLIGEDVAVERCLITAASGRTSCTPVGTIGPGADLLTVETLAASSMGDHQALFIHPASDASQSYQRDLVQRSGTFGASCQMERILVHGRRAAYPYSPDPFTELAMSSCYGYQSGAL